VGAGLGAGISAASYRPCKPSPNFSTCFFDISREDQAPIFGIVGLVGGAVVGAWLPTSEIIYRGRVLSSIDHREGGGCVVAIILVPYFSTQPSTSAVIFDPDGRLSEE
jgi:hypothetical protein